VVIGDAWPALVAAPDPEVESVSGAGGDLGAVFESSLRVTVSRPSVRDQRVSGVDS